MQTPISRLRFRHLLGAVLAPLATTILPCAAEVKFDTQRVTETFFSEGAGVGDFNKDGKMDVGNDDKSREQTELLFSRLMPELKAANIKLH